MKKLYMYVISIIVAISLTSCAMTDSAINNDSAPTILEINNTIKIDEVIPIKKIDPIIDEEYSRSAGTFANEISYDTFQNDKSSILAIIKNLDLSMKNRDFDLWKKHIAPTSIVYWNEKINLEKLSTKLSSRGIVLSELNDYFVHMFIPSRIGRLVNEIRYLSPTEIKAVQVQGDKDIIYYEFEKIEGQWLVKLTTL